MPRCRVGATAAACQPPQLSVGRRRRRAIAFTICQRRVRRLLWRHSDHQGSSCGGDRRGLCAGSTEATLHTQPGVLEPCRTGPAFGDKRVSDQRSDAGFRDRMRCRPHACFVTPTPTKGGAAALVLSPRRGSQARHRRTIASSQTRSPRRGSRGDRNRRRALARRPPAGVIPLPRQQPSRRARRTTGSPRLSGSHAARGRRHPPRYCFPMAFGRAPQAKSDRPASADRAIASRGTRSCRSGEPDNAFRSKDPPTAGLRFGDQGVTRARDVRL